MVAAHLLVAGRDGEHLAQLAGLPAMASGWEVDQLVPEVMREIDAPALAREEAGGVVARLFVLVREGADYSAIRALAALAPAANYPGGLIDQAYQACEWLDWDCHDAADADQLQAEMMAMPRLHLPRSLAEELTNF